MNTGIGDAVNLAWKLKAVLQDGAGERLLDTYEEERIAFARTLVRTTDEAFSAATSPGDLARFVRTRIVPVVAPLAARIGPFRDWMLHTVSQLGISYRGGLLSQGEAGEVRGGDRLPWLDLGEEQSNYDGSSDLGWQVHVYGHAGQGLQDWCSLHALPLRAYPWRDGFQDAGLARDAVYLVRPDLHVGCAAHGAHPDALEAYFRAKGLKLPAA
jgi:hypothetical protein